MKAILPLQRNKKMPPSGFNQKSINGLLQFVKANYQSLFKKYENQKLSESDFLEVTVKEMEWQIRQLACISFPELSNEGLDGLIIFVSECYKDLVSEIYSGHDKYGRDVVQGLAIQKEIRQISEYLAQFKI